MVISEPSSFSIVLMWERLLPYISGGRVLLLGWWECRGVARGLRLVMVGCRLANRYRAMLSQLVNDDEISMEYKEAFRQQTIIGWKYIFMGKFAKG